MADVLMDAITGTIRAILTKSGVDVLVGVTVNIFLIVIAVFECAVSSRLKEFRC